MLRFEPVEPDRRLPVVQLGLRELSARGSTRRADAGGPLRRRTPRAARARTRGSSRASRSARPTRRSRLLSTSDSSASRSAAQTASAASSVHRPRRPRAGEEPLLLLGEKLVAPVDRRPQRLWRPARRAARRSAGRAAAEPLQDRCRGEHAHPRRRELDCERQTVEAAAELGDHVVRPELGRRGRRRARPPRVGQWRNRVSCSAGGASGSRLVTKRRGSGSDASTRRAPGAASIICSKLSSRRALRARRSARPRRRLAPYVWAISARAPGRAAPPARPSGRRSELADQRGRRLERQPRLPRSARPGQRHQARAVAAQEPEDSSSSRSRPINDAAGRQVRLVRNGSSAVGNRSLPKLEDPHRLREVLQSVLAEVARARRCRRARAVDGGDDHLAAVAGRRRCGRRGARPRRRSPRSVRCGVPVCRPMRTLIGPADERSLPLGRRPRARPGRSGRRRRRRPPACPPPRRRDATNASRKQPPVLGERLRIRLGTELVQQPASSPRCR